MRSMSGISLHRSNNSVMRRIYSSFVMGLPSFLDEEHVF